MQSARAKPYRGIGMEGVIAHWYAKNTAGDIEDFRRTARMLADRLPSGAQILEIAPGPGYLAIELARLGPYRITGLDISKSFVRIAAENARRAGHDVEFRLGDAHALPFAAGSLDCIVCRAAFKNFSDPATALGEMRRTLAAPRERGDSVRAWSCEARSDDHRHAVLHSAHVPDHGRSQTSILIDASAMSQWVKPALVAIASMSVRL